MMLHLIPPALIMCFSVLVKGQAEDFRLTDRAYVNLQKQDLGEAWCWTDVRPVSAGSDADTQAAASVVS